MITFLLRRKAHLGNVLASTVLTVVATTSMAGDWPMFGQSPANTASSTELPNLSIDQIGRLAPLWTFTTGGDVSARAAVVLGVLPKFESDCRRRFGLRSAGSELFQGWQFRRLGTRACRGPEAGL
jgi:hypothetical protein